MHGRHGEHTTRKALGRQCCRLSIQMPSLSQLVDLDPDVVLFAGSKWFKTEIPSRHESHVLRLNGVFFSLQVSSEPTARYRHVIKMSTQKHKITIIWGCLKFFATICVSFSPACFAGCIFLRVAICTAWTEKQKMIGFCANHFAWVTASPNSFTGAKHRAKKVITLYLIWCLKIYLLCMLIVFAKRKPVCCSRSLYAFSIIGLVWLPVGYLFVPFSPPFSSSFFSAPVQVTAVSPCSKATPPPQEFVKVKVVPVVVPGAKSTNSDAMRIAGRRHRAAVPKQIHQHPLAVQWANSVTQHDAALSAFWKSITGIAETKLRHSWWHACQRYGYAVPIQFHRCRDGVKDTLLGVCWQWMSCHVNVMQNAARCSQVEAVNAARRVRGIGLDGSVSLGSKQKLCGKPSTKA